MKKLVLCVAMMIPLFVYGADRLIIADSYNYVTHAAVGSGNSLPEISYMADTTAADADSGVSKTSDENLIRRTEVIFFGSMTFIMFLGWLTFSAYNSIIYADTFGTLKRYQFLTLYLGGGVLALSVSLSDLYIRLKPHLKKVEFYSK